MGTRIFCVVFASVVGWWSLSPARAVSSMRPARGADLPSLVLWAWERPEDLRTLEPRIGVAFLSQTITIGDHTMVVIPRRQPLRVSPATPLVAVTRIESSPSVTASLDDEGVDAVARAIAATSQLPQVAAVQIDFDATESERELYRSVLRRVREQLDPGTPLSMTALASWCVGDRWLRDLPIDEAVPMLFRMGPYNEPYKEVAVSADRAAEACAGAVGTSLDEPLRIRARGRRVYVFNAKAWTPAAVASAKAASR